jgi:Uma2 family endonuclease
MEGTERKESMITSAYKEEIPLYRRKLFTREEYDRIAEKGLFEGQRIELVEGEILCMSPIGTKHNVTVDLAGELCRSIFGSGYRIRVQSSFIVPGETELELDVAVVPGRARDYLLRNPDTAALIVEVAETSLAYDTSIKAGLYARAGVPDYWVLDVVTPRLIAHRDPGEMPEQPYGFGYRDVRVYQAGEEIAPLAKPDASIPVADLLP